MKYLNQLLASCCVMSLWGCVNTGEIVNPVETISNAQQTKAFYNDIRDSKDVSALNLFFTNMPKGGDLHHHYSGSVYAETYLDWVQNNGWFINSCDFKIVKPSETVESDCNKLTVAQLQQDNKAYRQLLTLWSDKDYNNHVHAQVPPDSHFFNTFSYFGRLSNDYMGKGLRLIKSRAQAENVGYIETMLSRTSVNANQLFGNNITKLNQSLRAAKSQQEVNVILDEMVGDMNANEQFPATIDTFVNKVEGYHRDIDDENFTMRYQTYALRVLSPVQVFSDLYAGYVAAKKSAIIVGVNIVAPENNQVALSDYTLHMRMYHYLGNKYPDIGRALHAGELTLGMVRPKDLLFHINEALHIAGAQRIGHGIDLPYEQNAIELLAGLKQNAAVEINLTSNEFILGVEGKAHPYMIYSAYGVPLVISTDDSGVSRNNLSNEYALLATRYQPSYASIKKYVYNSIHYSFLTENEKFEQIKRLDNNFDSFEENIAQLASDMQRN